jgi:hypothetical protein
VSHFQAPGMNEMVDEMAPSSDRSRVEIRTMSSKIRVRKRRPLPALFRIEGQCDQNKATSIP